ncbi:MAG: FIST N-terminal domain-containing protein [Rikenellaceae bacterium]|nr:FIST N-terminal domain-containing protein [Rikenellaceae bacterium]
MKQVNYRISSMANLCEILQSKEIVSFCSFQSQLVQIYSAKNDAKWYHSIGNEIRKVFPSAVIVGASSVGEICDGKMFTDSTAIIFSFFENSSLNLFSYECKLGREAPIAKALVKEVNALGVYAKGMLLLSTPITSDAGNLFNNITSCNLGYPVFGGGAGDYANKRNTLVFDGERCYEQGVISVVFSGDTLQIEPFTYLGWQPLSKEMTITETGELSIKSLDGKPAFSVYEKYLGIKADDNFFQNSLEFPFLFYRNGQMVARTPFFVNEKDGSIQMVGDLKVGEKVRIGYGNPQMILAESGHIQKQMQNFKPEAIFLYTCICRRFLLQQDANLETMPFNDIAPTAGFYTFGEFCSNGTVNSLLNSTMVAVGLREGANGKETARDKSVTAKNVRPQLDPYMNKHSRILSRLLYFINVTTKELEEQNKLLKTLNEQKNEFLGIAAHDLRNPIGVILGFSELLKENIGDDFKEYTGEITKMSSKMLNLLDDLLDYSKIEAGKLDIKREITDYNALVAQNIRMNELLAKSKGIKIFSDFEKTGLFVSVDEGKINQVLNNLIGNAIKYSYPDSTITIKVFKEDEQVMTQIIDEGQGIPEKEIEGLFNPFKRASVQPTNGETSHGLGLAIVKKIIEGHNGRVGVTSEYGKGSVFYFTLPM